MPGGYVYIGEAAGARILRTAVGLSQVGDAYQLEVFTWDDRPLGEDGECIFRWLAVLLRHTNGYSVEVTPVIDGQSVSSYTFSGGAPTAGTENVERLRLWPMRRGNRIGVMVRTLALLGPTELVDVEYGYAPIRTGR